MGRLGNCLPLSSRGVRHCRPEREEVVQGHSQVSELVLESWFRS